MAPPAETRPSAKQFLIDHHVFVFGSPDHQQINQWDIAVSSNTLSLKKRVDATKVNPHGVVFSATEKGVSADVTGRVGQESVLIHVENVTDVDFNHGKLVIVDPVAMEAESKIRLVEQNVVTGEVRQGIQGPDPIHHPRNPTAA